MEIMPLVSIVVPTYNAGNSILLTLKSIYTQDYKHIEVIVCDDGSNDDTVVIVEDFFYHNQGINYRIIKGLKNEGTVKNINRGYEKCHGKYIKPIGQGDYFISEDVIRKLVLFAEDNYSDVVFGNMKAYRFQNNEIEIIGYSAPEKYLCKKYENPEDAKRLIVGMSKYISGSLLFYKREAIFNKNIKLPSSVKYCEDLVQVMLCLYNYKFSYIPMDILYYEFGVGISTRVGFYKNKKMKSDHLAFYKWLLKKRINLIYKYWIYIKIIKIDTNSTIVRILLEAFTPVLFVIKIKRKIARINVNKGLLLGGPK